MALIKKFAKGNEIQELLPPTLEELLKIYPDHTDLIVGAANAINKALLEADVPSTLYEAISRLVAKELYERLGSNVFNPKAIIGPIKKLYNGSIKNPESFVTGVLNKYFYDSLLRQNNVSNSPTNYTYTLLVPQSPTSGNYLFQWNKYLNTDYISDNDDLKTRANLFLNALRNSINETISAQSSNKKIHGLTPEVLAELPKILNTLSSEDFSTQNWDINNLETLNGQILYLKDKAMQLGIPFEDFSRFFPEWFNPSLDVLNKRNLKALGYSFNNTNLGDNITNYLKSKGYNYATKDGKHYILDSNWEFITLPISEIFDDASDTSTYGKGLFSNEAGEFIFGDVDTYLEGNNPWSKIVLAALTKVNESRKGIARAYNYDYIYGNGGDLANAVRDLLKRSFSYADVSSMFSGDDQIIAVAPEGKKISFDKFGNILFNPGTVFWYKDKSDNLISTEDINKVKLDLNASFNYTGFVNELPDQAGGYGKIKINGDTTITGDEDLMKRPWYSMPLTLGIEGAVLGGFLPGGSALGAGLGAAAGAVLGLLGYSSLDDINEDPLGFFDMMVTALSNPEGDDADKVVGPGEYGINNRDIISSFGGITNIMPFLEKLLREGNAKLTPEYIDKWRGLVNAYKDIQMQTLVNYEKLGGILKAEYGTELNYGAGKEEPKIYNGTGDSKTARDKTLKEYQKYNIDEARKNGYDNLSEYVANNRKPTQDLSTTDIIRFASMAADVASIPAAWVAGYGSFVSAALGVGSSAATFVTDVAEDGFQFRDLGGLAVNLGLSLTNTITAGAGGIAKITKNLIKYGSLCYAAWGTMANGDKYAKILDKVNDGLKLTVEDWRLLALGLALIAGANRTMAGAYKTRMIKNNANIDKLAKEGKLGKTTLSVKDGKKVIEKELTGELAEQVRNAKDIDEVNGLLKTFFPDSELKAVPKKARTWKFWKGKLDTKDNPYSKQLNGDLEIATAEGKPNNDAIVAAAIASSANRKYTGRNGRNSGSFANLVNYVGKKMGGPNDLEIALGVPAGSTAAYRKKAAAESKNKNTQKSTSENTLKNTNEPTTGKAATTTQEAAATTQEAPKPNVSEIVPETLNNVIRGALPYREPLMSESGKQKALPGGTNYSRNTTNSNTLTSLQELIKYKFGPNVSAGEALRRTVKVTSDSPDKYAKRMKTVIKHINAGKYSLLDFIQNPNDYYKKYRFNLGGRLDKLRIYVNNK